MILLLPELNLEIHGGACGLMSLFHFFLERCFELVQRWQLIFVCRIRLLIDSAQVLLDLLSIVLLVLMQIVVIEAGPLS